VRRDPLANPEVLIRRVYSYVAYRIGPGPDAEDVTSEAFARAVRGRNQYDHRRGEPISWLLGIAQRCISDFYAQRRQEGELVDGESPHEFERITLERLMLEKALAALGERDFELVALRYGADLSTRQIAEVLDLSPGAVRVALHRALARLRVELDEAEAAPVTRTPVGLEPAQ
jgi:RNA polymerase sigma-70 factor (ECF subfamily)